ncbi:MAG: DUF3109 family protein [Deltaproteobacteria bacterium]|nr:DUF3109 family protein [Deltaproteobacteria bacterium]
MRIDPLIFQAKFPESCRPEQCRSRCCRFGVWADAEEGRTILLNRDLFLPYVRPEAADPSCWFGDTTPDRDCASGIAVETQVVGDACAFFHPGHGCALQKGAIEAGMHEWRFKPRFCVMFPLVLSEGTLTVDEEMKSLWCMKEKNRTHPIAEAVRKEVQFLFGQEMAQVLTRQPRAR